MSYSSNRHLPHDSDSESNESTHSGSDENRVSDGKLHKTITLISFGYGNGKPRAYDEDIIISVKNMFSVHKTIRDKYDGTAEELQHALLDIDANKLRYDEIIEELKAQLTEILNSEEDEEVSIYIGCEAGRHRSVAVVCMLQNELPDIIKSIEVQDRDTKEIEIKVEHRDLHSESRRQNKKFLNQDRSRRRDQKNRFGGGAW